MRNWILYRGQKEEFGQGAVVQAAEQVKQLLVIKHALYIRGGSGMRVENMIKRTVKGVKEVDFYTPVRIDYAENDEKYKELFYYRMLNEKSSFIEVTVNSIARKIVSITTVSINDKVKINNEILEKQIA